MRPDAKNLPPGLPFSQHFDFTGTGRHVPLQIHPKVWQRVSPADDSSVLARSKFVFRPGRRVGACEVGQRGATKRQRAYVRRVCTLQSVLCGVLEQRRAWTHRVLCRACCRCDPVHFATSRAEGRRGTAPAVLEQVSTPGFWLERALGAVLRARSHLQRRLLLLQGQRRAARGSTSGVHARAQWPRHASFAGGQCHESRLLRVRMCRGCALLLASGVTASR